jgi:hypothetical protein
VKSKIGDPAKDSTNRISTTRNKKRQQNSKIFWVARRVPLVRGEWSLKKQLYKPEFPS